MESQQLLNKFLDLRNLYIKHLQKESTQDHTSVKNKNYFRERKSFCFLQQDHINFTQVFPKVLLGTLLKQKL